MAHRSSAASAGHLTDVSRRTRQLRSLEDLIRVVAPKVGETPDEVTRRILAEASNAERQSILAAALVAEVSTRLRATTRDVERGVGDLREPPTPSQRQKRQALSLRDFWLDGEHIPWGGATVEQHRARAAYLRQMAADTVATAVRHEQAAEAIEAAGVTCLNELPDQIEGAA